MALRRLKNYGRITVSPKNNTLPYRFSSSYKNLKPDKNRTKYPNEDFSFSFHNPGFEIIQKHAEKRIQMTRQFINRIFPKFRNRF